MDEAATDAAASCGAIVTVEGIKHAGMGCASPDSRAKAPTPIEFVGVEVTFGRSGDPFELVGFYGMASNAIEATGRARPRAQEAGLIPRLAASQVLRSASGNAQVFRVQIVEHRRR
jgi:hypothetical protein